MKVTVSDENILDFSNGLKIIGDGDEDCCAYNYLDFEQLPVGTEFEDMGIGQLVESIVLKDDGFSIKDIHGTPKWVQARSQQNGYYSNRTTIEVTDGVKKVSLGELSGEIDE